MTGWFSVTRGIFDHPIFNKRPDRLYVWLWMLRTAAWKDTRQSANGRPVEVKRGQILTSYRQISAATGVGKQVIETLISLLRDEDAITTDTKTGRILITICNYEKYQSKQDTAKTEEKTEPRQSQDTKETREQINNIPTSSDDAAAPSLMAVEVDPINKAVWDFGVQLLSSRGVKSPRPIIGGWLRDHPNPTAVLEALRDAQKAGTQDPIPYIKAILKSGSDQRKSYRTDARGRPEIGSTMVNKRGEHLRYVNHFEGWMREYA